MRDFEELERAERRNRALLDAIPDNMFRIRLDGTYVDFHSNHPGSLTLPPDRIIGTNLADHMSPAEAARRLEAIERVVESGRGESFELQIVGRTGEVVDQEVRMEKSGEDEVLAITRDVTERKRAERELVRQQEELRRSRTRIIGAEATERRRLERNLHDGAQSRLVALSLALRLAQSQVPANPDAAVELLANATSELAQALEELRALARGLHPAILADRGLGPALDALAERSPLPVEVETGLDGRLPEPVEVAVYYIVSEALTNVAKYAQASQATVGVQCLDGGVVVEVADNGVGGADPAAGSGLRGLVDRVEALDGRLSVESSPGSGTRISARIPLASDRDSSA
jgi:PAS domain S-box-containing protein